MERNRWREPARFTRYGTERENPGGEEAQESYGLAGGLNPRRDVPDARVEQDPGVEGHSRLGSDWFLSWSGACLRACDGAETRPTRKAPTGWFQLAGVDQTKFEDLRVV